MKRALKFIASIFGDIAGQILTVIGFFMLLGGVAASIWGMAVAGAILLVLGFFLFSSK